MRADAGEEAAQAQQVRAVRWTYEKSSCLIMFVDLFLFFFFWRLWGRLLCSVGPVLTLDVRSVCMEKYERVE